ncbi:MAG: hypothetical protein J6U20_02625 [Fibrobacter sp.]|nr:hypothetical protein [Fibrobacter sp.]
MKNRIFVALTLLFVATTCVTCGNEVTYAAEASSNGEVQIAEDVDLFKYECDISEDGVVFRINSSNEVIVCQYDEYLEDWGWIPQNN